MTLQEAIKRILKGSSKPLNFEEVTNQININHLYHRKDGKPVSISQVKQRVYQYPGIFDVNSGGDVFLKDPIFSILKSALEKISDTLRFQNDRAQQLILPACAIYIQYGIPIHNIRNPYSDIMQIFLQELRRINDTTRFLHLLDVPIDIISNLNHSIASSIVYILRDITFELTSHKLTEEEFAIFFNELINEFSWKKNFRNELKATPSKISTLISQLVKLKKNDTVFDPFTGASSLLCKIAQSNLDFTNFRIVAGDLDEDSIIISKLNFAVNNITKYEIYNRDAFTGWAGEGNFADYFISNPPFIRTTPHVSNEYLNYTPGKDSSITVISLALHHLKFKGKAFIIVPENFIFSSGKAYYNCRRDLIERNFVSGIISLPTGLFYPYSNVKTSLLILDKGRNKTEDKTVFFYDAANHDKPEQFDELIKEIANLYFAKEVSAINNSGYVLIEEIRNINYNFDLGKVLNAYYLDPQKNHTRLKEVVKYYFSGNNIKADNLSSSGDVPYIQISDLKNEFSSFTLVEDDLRRFVVNHQKISGNLKYVTNNSILIAKVGERIKPTIYRGHSGKVLCSSNILVLELDNLKILPEYFIAKMHETYVTDQLGFIKQGSVYPNIVPKDFLNIIIDLPPIEEQRKLADAHFQKIINIDSTESNENFIVGELKHKIKGPLGSLQASIKRLQKYLERKELSREAISFKDLAYKILPDESIDNPNQYTLGETFTRIFSNIKRIDEYLIRANSFASLENDSLNITALNLYDFLSNDLIPDVDKRIKIQLPVKKDMERVKILADISLLKAVFENFIDNALIHGFNNKPNENSQINIYWKINLSDDVTRKNVVITVENNGKILPADFTKSTFIKKGVTTNGKNGSSGIGGAFIDKALKQMNGDLTEVINASKKLDEFKTKFIFKLPIDEQ